MDKVWRKALYTPLNNACSVRLEQDIRPDLKGRVCSKEDIPTFVDYTVM
jgi:hypothetical protein